MLGAGRGLEGGNCGVLMAGQEGGGGRVTRRADMRAAEGHVHWLTEEKLLHVCPNYSGTLSQNGTSQDLFFSFISLYAEVLLTLRV